MPLRFVCCANHGGLESATAFEARVLAGTDFGAETKVRDD